MSRNLLLPARNRQLKPSDGGRLWIWNFNTTRVAAPISTAAPAAFFNRSVMVQSMRIFAPDQLNTANVHIGNGPNFANGYLDSLAPGESLEVDNDGSDTETLTGVLAGEDLMLGHPRSYFDASQFFCISETAVAQALFVTLFLRGGTI